MAVGEADGLVAEGVAGGTGNAGLAGTGLAGDDGVLALLDTLDEVADDALLARGQPELVVIDLFGERRGSEAEVIAIVGHDSSPSDGRFLPSARSSRALGGSKAVRVEWGASRHDDERVRWAFLLGLTG